MAVLAQHDGQCVCGNFRGCYIDDIIAHRQDDDPTQADGYEKVWFHLTDAQFSTVAIIDANANVAERVTYTAYGRARHHWFEDVDGDGDHDTADLNLVSSLAGKRIQDVGYRAEADLDRDGQIGRRDYSLANSSDPFGTGFGHAALAEGVLSSSAIDNQIGWDGYVFNAEVETYLTRIRTYSITLGRFLQRDPAGFIDGMNMYLYGLASPIDRSDALGLATNCPTCVSVCCTPRSDPPAWNPPPGKRGPIFNECQKLYTEARMKCLNYPIGSPDAQQCYRRAEIVLTECNMRMIAQGITPGGSGFGAIAQGFGEGLCDGALAFCKGVGKFAANTVDCIVCGTIPDDAIEDYFNEIDQFMFDPTMKELVVSEACGQVYGGCVTAIVGAGAAGRGIQAKYPQSTCSDFIRTGPTWVPRGVNPGRISGAGARCWGIKGGGVVRATGQKLPYHFHIHKYNVCRPWTWFRYTPTKP